MSWLRNVGVGVGLVGGAFVILTLREYFSKLGRLCRAVERGDMHAVRRTVLSRPGLANASDSINAPPLEVAVRSGHWEIAEFLLEHGADPNHSHTQDDSPLHCAVRGGDPVMVEMLLANGADVNAVVEDGNTPLMTAVLNGHEEVAEILISSGAEVDMFSASGMGLVGEVSRTLREDPTRADAQLAGGSRPLHWAAKGGQDRVVELLLDHNAEVGATDWKKNTPLHLAASGGSASVVRLLLAHGADVSKKNADGKTPRDLALESQYRDLAEALRPDEWGGSQTENRGKSGA